MLMFYSGSDPATQILSVVTPTLYLDARYSSKVTRDGSNIVSQWDNVHTTALGATEATNRPRWVANAINNQPAVEFYHAGAMTQIQIADDAALNYTQFYCLTVFQRVTDLAASEFMVGKFATGSPANQREWNMMVDSSDRLAAVGSNDGTATVNPNVTGAISTGAPTIGEAWYDGANLTVVRNGNLAGAGTAALGSAFNGTSPFFLGARDGGTNPYAGYIGMILFTTSLPSAEQRLALRRIAAQGFGISI